MRWKWLETDLKDTLDARPRTGAWLLWWRLVSAAGSALIYIKAGKKYWWDALQTRFPRTRPAINWFWWKHTLARMRAGHLSVMVDDKVDEITLK